MQTARAAILVRSGGGAARFARLEQRSQIDSRRSARFARDRLAGRFFAALCAASRSRCVSRAEVIAGETAASRLQGLDGGLDSGERTGRA